MANGDSRLLTPLGQLVTIVATVVAGVLAMTVQMYSIKMEIQSVKNVVGARILLLEQKMATLPAADRWRGQDMLIWSTDLRELNPDVKVPDPRVTIRDRMQNGDSGPM